MTEISITLNQEYKSYESGFETVLKGALIILSGVNGSGKSQLIEIIKGSFLNTDGNKAGIVREVKADNKVIKSHNTEFKSFKDSALLAEIQNFTLGTLEDEVVQAYNAYQRNKLECDQNPDYSGSCIQARKIIEKAFGEFSLDLSESKFKQCFVGSRFTWRNNDAFANGIGIIFLNHANQVAHGERAAGKRGGEKYDSSVLGDAPWTELNILFEELKLDYRFKDNYELGTTRLNEAPCLYSIDEKGKIIENEKRDLKDLSDGEKTIISLCFTSLRKSQGENRKLLLLDELDALLNPSLTEKLFTVLKKYYLDKDITVIITTHSPATISLAPESAVYYEIFRKGESKNRVVEVAREEYKELQIANKKFYAKIADQKRRIQEFEAIIETNEYIVVVTEGKTDWKYFLGALKYYHGKNEFKEIKEDYFLRHGSKEDVKGKVCGTKVFLEFNESELNKALVAESNVRKIDSERCKKICIGIFDDDTRISNHNNPDYNVHSFKIQSNQLSAEFLFSDGDIKTIVPGLDKRLYIGDEFDQTTGKHKNKNLGLNLGPKSSSKAGKRTIIERAVIDSADDNIAIPKEKFAQAILNQEINISEESWEKFRHIFDNIRKIISNYASKPELTPTLEDKETV